MVHQYILHTLCFLFSISNQAIGDKSEEDDRKQLSLSLQGYDKALDALRKAKGIDWEEQQAQNLDMQKSLFKNKAVCNLKLAMSHSKVSTKMIYFQVLC